MPNYSMNVNWHHLLKTEKIADEKGAMYGSGLDVTKATEHRLRQSMKYTIGRCQPKQETKRKNKKNFSIT